MKANYLFILSLLLYFQISLSQVGIGTPMPDPSSELEVSSPLNDKGVLIPRMNQAQRNAIVLPATSLLIYQTDSIPGFYYYDGTVWVGIIAGASTDWTLLGNAGTSAGTNFLGTTDDVDIVLKRNGIRAGLIGNPIGATPSSIDKKNTSFGANSLLTPTTGYRNTAIGSNVLTVNTTGFRNVAIGNESLSKNNSGNTNVAVGDLSMFENLTGSSNTAVGTGSLYTNIAGTNNTAIGRNALTASTASFDTALGDRALEFNSTGTNNVATGNNSLNKNTGGNNNTATGVQALRSNTTGGNNTAIGYQTLSGNPTILANVSTFSNSTAVGYQSFYNNLTGSNNVGLGYQAGFSELGSDKLYIENTNADSNNALIYGDFTAGAKILRTNSTFQIGNPAITGYSFPTARPATAAGQVLQYNSVGALTFQTPAAALNSYAWLTTGNTATATDFIGTNNAFPLRFVASGTERMRIVPTTGEVIVGNTTAIAGDKFSAYAAGAEIAAHGYSTLTGRSIQGDNSGSGIAIFGNNSGTGRGVEGDSVGVGFGVLGFNTGTGTGVYGGNTGNGQSIRAVNSSSTSTANTGFFGQNSTGLVTATYGNSAAVWGQSLGIRGGTFLAAGASPNTTALQGSYSGVAGNYDGFGVFGSFNSNPGWGYGVVGQGGFFGVFAFGDSGATGTKTFTIDHPNDPENKYLKHFSMESNEVLNMYRGNVVLDSNGDATVILPDYFDEININFSYNLTPIGKKAEVYIKEEVLNNQFKISGGNPNQKISWQVFGERNDLYLQRYPEKKEVEVFKKQEDKGLYLMPELYNLPQEKGVLYRHKSDPSKVKIEDLRPSSEK